MNVYGLLLFCKRFARIASRYDCSRYPVSLIMPSLVGASGKVMGTSHVSSQTPLTSFGSALLWGFLTSVSTCSPSSIMFCNRGDMSSCQITTLRLCSLLFRCKHRVVGHCSLCTIAQAIRAVLFANATVATFTCFRAVSSFSHWLSPSSRSLACRSTALAPCTSNFLR